MIADNECQSLQNSLPHKQHLGDHLDLRRVLFCDRGRASCRYLRPADAGASERRAGCLVNAGKSLVGTVCRWEQPGKPGDELLKLDIAL